MHTSQTETTGLRVFIYDADCGLCTRTVEWLQGRGADRSLSFQPCQRSDELMNRAGLTSDDCMRNAYLLCDRGEDIATHRGAGAINAALRLLPGARNAAWRLAGRTYLIPGIKQVQDVMYRWIARNRNRFSSGSVVCSRRDA